MIPFPKKKYNIIYADPPWSFETYSDKGKEKSADNHYECQDIEWIKNLPVKDITDDNCILFMWVTFPTLHQCFDVIKSWGFKYSTCGFVWVKSNKKYNKNQLSFVEEEKFDVFWGLGYWTRSNAEICLIAKKGTIERQSRGVHQIVYEPIDKHSKKPDCVKEKIVQLCGDLPRIELFARQKTKDWDVWGNEVCMI